MKSNREIFVELADEAPAAVGYVLRKWMKYFFITMAVIATTVVIGAIGRWIGNALDALIAWANSISEEFAIAVFVVISVLFITFIAAILKAVWNGINDS